MRTRARTPPECFWAGGTLINKAGGSIVDKREDGVYVGGPAGVTITNAGKISGAVNAIQFDNAGTSSDAPMNTLTLETGSKLIGAVVGSMGAFVTNDLILKGKAARATRFQASRSSPSTSMRFGRSAAKTPSPPRSRTSAR